MTAKVDQFSANNPNPVLCVDKEGTVLYSNKAGKPLLQEWGADAGKLPLGKLSFGNLSFGKLPSELRDLVQRILSQNSPEKKEVKVGNKVYLVSFQPQPETESVNIYGFDITDQKELEGRLKESEKKYRNIVETTNEGVWAFNEFAETSYVNNKMAEMLGYSKEDLIGKYIWDYADEADRDIFKSKLASRKQGIDEVYELKLLRRDGSEFWVLISAKAFFDECGNFAGSLGMFTDITERKKMEEALRESEDRFRSVLENSLDSAYRYDLQHDYFDYMSPVIEQITGFSPAEINAMLKNELFSQTHADDNSQTIAGIIQSLDEGFGTHEYRFKCKDGKYRWLADHFSTIKDKTGKPRFRAGFVRDITRRKKVEEALRLSNLYNRSLIEASLDPLVTIGHDGKITDVNGATEKVTGFSRDQLIGTDFSDYFTQPEHARSGYQQVFIDGEVRDYPLIVQHREGHITPVLYNASVYRDEHGEVIGVFAAARDITELKKAEGKIQTLADAVESSDDAFITISFDGIIANWNKGAERVYGYLPEEVLGKCISLLEPENLKGEINQLVEKIKQGERIQHYETLRLKKDGSVINVSVTHSPVFNSAGELVEISIIARDITDKKVREKLLQEKQMAEVANLTKSEFLANMSHELRTPLNSIIGFSDMLHEQMFGDLNKKQMRYVENISNSGKHLLKLINNLLDISKIEAGKMELIYKNFELEARLITIRNMLYPLADKKNIDIDINVDSGLGVICADEDKFVQVMYNLVDNAIKFSYENSHIKIEAREKGEMVEIMVKDSGIGIKFENQDKLFKPFSQIDSFSSLKTRGTGLGLSLVKQIVQMHGGYIWFRSNLNEGSTFAFAIPKNRNKANGQCIELVHSLE